MNRIRRSSQVIEKGKYYWKLYNIDLKKKVALFFILYLIFISVDLKDVIMILTFLEPIYRVIHQS